MHFEKTADISLLHNWFPCKMTSEKRAQKFHTDDATWAFHKVLEIFQKVSRNFWKVSQKMLKKQLKVAFVTKVA